MVKTYIEAEHFNQWFEIVSDITSGKYRVSAVCLFEQFWSIGVILLPGAASWWNNWGTIYIAISVPTVTLFILYYWIPDSPRWLLKHGKVQEALKVLMVAAKVNEKNDFSEDDLNKQLIELANSMRNDPPEATLLSIWDVPFVIKFRLFVGHIGWSGYLILYYASLLNVRAMGRNYLEINTVMAGISEIIGAFIALYLILNKSKKWLYTSQFNIATSLIAYSANYVPHSFPPFERMVIYMGALMLVKISISTSIAIFITSMTEIMPPDKKKMCNYSGVTCSRTLVMIAPFIGYCGLFGQFGKTSPYGSIDIITNEFICSASNYHVGIKYLHFVAYCCFYQNTSNDFCKSRYLPERETHGRVFY